MSRFSYVTLDCYGTLIDWRSGIGLSFAKAFGAAPGGVGRLMDEYAAAERRQESTYKAYRDVLRGVASDLSRRFGFDPSAKATDAFAASVPDWPAFGDTAEALRALGRMGFRRYILSNVDEDMLRMTMERNHLEVDGVVTAEETRTYKPSHGHWERFLEKTGAAKDEVLHVAQSLFHDIVPASDLGISSAWVNRYGEPLGIGVRPLYICDSLAALAALLENERAP